MLTKCFSNNVFSSAERNVGDKNGLARGTCGISERFLTLLRAVRTFRTGFGVVDVQRTPIKLSTVHGFGGFGSVLCIGEIDITEATKMSV